MSSETLKEKARALIERYVAIKAGPERCLVDKDGKAVKLSPPPLPSWVYRVAKVERNKLNV